MYTYICKCGSIYLLNSFEQELCDGTYTININFSSGLEVWRVFAAALFGWRKNKETRDTMENIVVEMGIYFFRGEQDIWFLANDGCYEFGEITILGIVFSVTSRLCVLNQNGRVKNGLIYVDIGTTDELKHNRQFANTFISLGFWYFSMLSDRLSG